MSCPYYWWNNHFACRKSGKDVNEDIYYKYCRNYDYGDCPIYKGDSGSSGGCFLTSACTEAKGLPDDCDELTTLRFFRDSYLKNRAGGVDDIKEYYEKAPAIVAAIRSHDDTYAIFGKIYEDLVFPCVEMIKNGQYEDTYKYYKGFVLNLEREFVK